MTVKVRPLVHLGVRLPRTSILGGEPTWWVWTVHRTCTLVRLVVVDDESGLRERDLLVDVRVLTERDDATPQEACRVAVSAVPRMTCAPNDQIAVRFYASGRTLMVVPMVEVDL